MYKRQVLDDVKDGIYRGISFGYSIEKFEEMEDGLRAVSWVPHEVSLATIPADNSVGFGRSLIEPLQGNSINIEDKSPIEEINSAVEPASPTVRTMEESTKETAVDTAPAVEIDVNAEVQRAIDENNARTAEITTLCREYKQYGAEDIADALIRGNKSPNEAKAAILDLVKNKAEVNNTPIRSTDMIEPKQSKEFLDKKEVKQFSFLRAINALASPGDKQAQEAATFEREVYDEAAKRYGRTAKGIMVTKEVLKLSLINI